jgi:hypothetical protein
MGNEIMRVPTARQLYTLQNSTDERNRDRLETLFFGSIRLQNGTYKFTYRQRLDDLNELCNRLLPPQHPLEIMDVAVSSGVSTLEWLDSLRKAGVKCHITAGDLVVDAVLLSVGRYLHVLLDKQGYPLQFDIFGNAVPNPPGRRNLLLYSAPLLVIRAALRLYSGRPDAILHTGRVRKPWLKRLISLRTVPMVVQNLVDCPEVRVIEDNILESFGWENRFHVVRAANILNRDYFSDQTLTQMLHSLRKRLKQAGMLIVCSTDDWGTNHGTVFRLKRSGCFEALGRIGQGSEIEDLVLQLTFPSLVSAPQ